MKLVWRHFGLEVFVFVFNFVCNVYLFKRRIV